MKYIDIQSKNQITNIILNRPEIHNAFDPEMIQNLTKAFEEISNDNKTRIVILTGNGRSFSAGADLNWMNESKAFSYEKNLEDAQKLEKMFYSIYSCPKPVIGRINGHAFGGGVGLIATCDITLAIEQAKFGFTEANLGIIPAVISPYVIPKIGFVNASRYFLTAERFDANTGKEIGLINQVTKDFEALDDAVNKLLDELFTSGPGAIAAAKKLIHNNRIFEFEHLRKYCINEIATLRTSEEGKEGLSAFLEKRKPKWIKEEE